MPVPEGSVDPGIAAPVAPAPAPEPQGSTYDPDTHIVVPKHNLADYDGRFGEALLDAKQYRQLKDQGLLDDGVLDFVTLGKDQFGSTRAAMDYITGANQVPPGQQPPAQPASGQPAYGQPAQPQFTPPVNPDEQPLTVGQFRQFQEANETAAQQKDRERQLNEEFVTVGNTLRGFKFNILDDGRPGDTNAEIGRSIFNGALNDEMKKDIPDWLSHDERVAAEKTISSTAASNAQIQRATELFKQRFADFKQNAVVDFVNNQESVPAGTLDAGPGGPVQKNFDEMSYEEQVAATDAGVRAQTGRGMGERA